MALSDTVRMALAKRGMSQQDLADKWGSTRQAINNKFSRDSWSGDDLMKLARITGGKLAMIYPDGQQLLFLPDEEKAGE